jgi:hypothetical protein
MRWDRDPFRRVAVVSTGDLLSIEYHDGGETLRIDVTPGLVEWEEPRVRSSAVNVGNQLCERVTIFLLDRSDAVAQPVEE